MLLIKRWRTTTDKVANSQSLHLKLVISFPFPIFLANKSFQVLRVTLTAAVNASICSANTDTIVSVCDDGHRLRGSTLPLTASPTLPYSRVERSFNLSERLRQDGEQVKAFRREVTGPNWTVFCSVCRSLM